MPSERKAPQRFSLACATAIVQQQFLVNDYFGYLPILIDQKNDLPSVVCFGLRAFNQIGGLRLGVVVSGKVSEERPISNQRMPT